MSTPFERLKRNTFDVAARTMGVDATWGAHTERVLFNEPDGKEERAEIEFNPTFYEMEYRIDQFPGLYESVREGNIEIITVGEDEFTARHALKTFDGGTYKVHLVPN